LSILLTKLCDDDDDDDAERNRKMKWKVAGCCWRDCCCVFLDVEGGEPEIDDGQLFGVKRKNLRPKFVCFFNHQNSHKIKFNFN